MNFEKLEKEFSKWSDLSSDPDLLRIVTSFYIANYLPGEPLWLALIGPPSSFKSKLLESLAGFDRTYLLSEATPAAFASGMKYGDSLIFRLTNKVLVIPEAGVLSTIHKDTRDHLLSILRQAYDGRYERETGTTTIKWEGKLGVIIGGTYEVLRKGIFEDLLGKRFIIVQVKLSDSDEMLDSALKSILKAKTMKKELEENMGKFLEESLTNLDLETMPKISKSFDLKLRDMIRALSKVRTPIPRHPTTREIEDVPRSEELPIRLYKQFFLFLLALSILNCPPDDVERIIKRVVQDNIPVNRASVLQKIIETPKTIVEIASETHIHYQATRRVIEELMCLNLVKDLGGRFICNSDILGEILS